MRCALALRFVALPVVAALGVLSCKASSRGTAGEGNYMIGAPGDTSPRGRMPTKDWFDEAGQKIKSRDSRGRVLLYTYDLEGHLVKQAGLAYTVAANDPDPEDVNPEAWAHFFSYDTQGQLVWEIDCRGDRIFVTPGTKLSPSQGTTLEKHEHLHPMGEKGLKPKMSRYPFQAELLKEEK